MIRYWPDYSFDEESRPSPLQAPDDDLGGWWSGIGLPGLAIAAFASAGLSVSAQASINMMQFMDDVPAQIVLPVDFEQSVQRIYISYGNSVTTFLGEAQAAIPAIRVNDEPDYNEPIAPFEPTVYIIGPGNWAVGNDEIARRTLEDDGWENQVAPQLWCIRQEKPWYIPDDPTSPRQPSGDSEQLPEIGPYADPLVYVIGPGNWAAGSDEVPRFFGLARDEDYWTDPNTITTPLGEIVPVRVYSFQQDEPRFFGRVVDEELWRNPKELLDYWNRWPRPDFQQDDPSGLFVPPDLSCVVEPVIGGIVGIGATFSTVTGLVVPFTDTCGNPL